MALLSRYVYFSVQRCSPYVLPCHRCTLLSVHHKLNFCAFANYGTAALASKGSLSQPQDLDQVSVLKVTSNMELRQLRRPKREVHVDDQAKSLVIIFFPFNFASSKLIKNYCDLYHKHGLDVLTVRGRFRDTLSMTSGRNLASELLSFMSRNVVPLNVGRVLVHSVSSGDYLCALVLNEIKEQPLKYSAVKRKIVGHVCDSPTTGLPTVPVAELKMTGKIIYYLEETFVNLYWKMFRENKEFRKKVQENFNREPVKGNVLVFYSFNDPVCDVQSVDKTIESWKRNRTTDVFVSSWIKSVHGQHLIEHPRQYGRAIHSFITKLHLVRPNTET